MIHKYAKKAGIQKVYGKDSLGRPLYTVTPHTLRHTHIVHALLDKVPITAIMSIARSNRTGFASEESFRDRKRDSGVDRIDKEVAVRGEE